MPFDYSIDYMHEYRNKRLKAIDNNIRQRWLTSDVGTVSALIELFNSAYENADWVAEDAKAEPDILKIQAHRLKVNWLAGCRRDLRMHFAAWSGHRVRVPLDWDRFAFMRVNFSRFKTELLRRVVQAKEVGLA